MISASVSFALYRYRHTLIAY
ncbi:hypothetical protein MED222_05725 [Vibrio sp. MED222]|nr:hypothetical protein MED222_05725 [Vibrio sp. MED222]